MENKIVAAVVIAVVLIICGLTIHMAGDKIDAIYAMI